MDVEELEKEEDGCFADLADQIALLTMDDGDDKAEPQESQASPVTYALQQHHWNHHLPWVCNNNFYYKHPLQEDLRNIPQILPVEISLLGHQQQCCIWANRNFTCHFTCPNAVIPSSIYNSKREGQCIGTGVFIPRCRRDSRSKRCQWLKFSSS